MLRKIFKYLINFFFKFFNLQVNKITLSNNFYYHIVQTLKNYDIDLVIDIGANEGQFAKKIIDYGFKNKIISFEPIKNVNKILRYNSKNHQNWIVSKSFGFGNLNQTQFINVSKNSVSSSILEINKKHLQAQPDARTIGKEKIRLITLNSYLNKYKFKNKKIFIKIDTQGYEKKIILGAKKVLNRVTGLMIEASISKVYKKETDYMAIINLMKKLGFYVWSIERGFTDKKTGQVLQLDIIFINKNAK
tara:strand:- start:18 stop:758 length:741 start_codon:yes stop_codon:yes gene_type:complete